MSAKEPLKDRDIREPLFLFLEEEYGKVRFIEEKTMGRSRADVLMVTDDALCGIEIKSDADSYTRLAAQVKNYDKYYDENYLVVGSTHAHHATEHVPEYWGIISVELIKGEVDFYAHCVVSAGIKRELWEKVGNIKDVGETKHILFKIKKDFLDSENQDDWEIWNINEEPLRIRVQDESFKQAYLGLVFQPERIIYRMKTGKSYGFYAEYD